LGSTVDYNGVQTNVTEISGFPPFTLMTTVVETRLVDAYGPMTLPGGRIVDALRIKIDEINIIQGPFPIYSRLKMVLWFLFLQIQLKLKQGLLTPNLFPGMTLLLPVLE